MQVFSLLLGVGPHIYLCNLSQRSRRPTPMRRRCCHLAVSLLIGTEIVGLTGLAIDPAIITEFVAEIGAVITKEKAWPNTVASIQVNWFSMENSLETVVVPLGLSSFVVADQLHPSSAIRLSDCS